MSDQSGLVSMPSTYNLDEVREAFLEGLGLARMLTVVRYTSGPQTLDGTQDFVTCDCTGGSFTVNLPATPSDGDTYELFKETAGNTLTIGRNGKNIDFAGSDKTLTSALSWTRITWSTSANSWLSRS